MKFVAKGAQRVFAVLLERVGFVSRKGRHDSSARYLPGMPRTRAAARRERLPRAQRKTRWLLDRIEHREVCRQRHNPDPIVRAKLGPDRFGKQSFPDKRS